MLLNKVGIEGCNWLATEGPRSGVVVSSRVRVARNLASFPFPHRADEHIQQVVLERVLTAIKQSPLLRDMEVLYLRQLSQLEREFLAERHIITADMMAHDRHSAVVVSADESISIMINEEDHLRLQSIVPGLDLEGAWERLKQVDEELEETLDFAYSPRLGYLTACPTNVGTGIRCSVMMHLFALVVAKEMEKVVKTLGQLGLTVRGTRGEGSEAHGDLFQISNQTTLGVSEQEAIDKVTKIVSQIADNEMAGRKSLLSDYRIMIEDRTWRAYGILSFARSLSSNEAIEYLSALRVGINGGLMRGIDNYTLNELMLSIRPAHLQRRVKRELGISERDVIRAAFVRSKLSGRAYEAERDQLT